MSYVGRLLNRSIRLPLAHIGDYNKLAHTREFAGRTARPQNKTTPQNNRKQRTISAGLAHNVRERGIFIESSTYIAHLAHIWLNGEQNFRK